MDGCSSLGWDLLSALHPTWANEHALEPTWIITGMPSMLACSSVKVGGGVRSRSADGGAPCEEASLGLI